MVVAFEGGELFAPGAVLGAEEGVVNGEEGAAVRDFFSDRERRHGVVVVVYDVCLMKRTKLVRERSMFLGVSNVDRCEVGGQSISVEVRWVRTRWRRSALVSASYG